MIEVFGGLSVRSILRAILAIALLLGSGAAGWAPATQAMPHDCCCGAVPASIEDSCPCPKPEGNRGPATPRCARDTVVVAVQAEKQAQAQRKVEPRSEPATWDEGKVLSASTGASTIERGRDPDLGRHLAQLSTFRI